MRIALHELMGKKGKKRREIGCDASSPSTGWKFGCVSFLESSEAWRLGLAYSELTYSSRR